MSLGQLDTRRKYKGKRNAFPPMSQNKLSDGGFSRDKSPPVSAIKSIKHKIKQLKTLKKKCKKNYQNLSINKKLKNSKKVSIPHGSGVDKNLFSQNLSIDLSQKHHKSPDKIRSVIISKIKNKTIELAKNKQDYILSAVIRIQCCFRRFMYRKWYLKTLERRHQGANLIQNYWKRYRRTCLVPKAWKIMKFRLKTLIQKYMRGYRDYTCVRKQLQKRRFDNNMKYFTRMKTSLQEDAQKMIRFYWNLKKRRDERKKVRTNIDMLSDKYENSPTCFGDSKDLELMKIKSTFLSEKYMRPPSLEKKRTHAGGSIRAVISPIKLPSKKSTLKPRYLM
ncbi:unnamed protein product [Moneuplotes crassus]|uniref:Uncharacterized protein n=1 Tax=Euplotes crassus TaxID=5936 RepID=A0AAD1XAA4_EUPCR|nr:unnamed protein product [Moneuplotes crassus]